MTATIPYNTPAPSVELDVVNADGSDNPSANASSPGLALSYRVDNGATVALTATNLSSPSAAYSCAGTVVGFGYVAGSRYRLDLPPAVATTAGAEVKVYGSLTSGAVLPGSWRVDVPVNSRSTYAGGPADQYAPAMNTSIGAIANGSTAVNVSSGSVTTIATAVWSAATAGLTVAGSIGKLFADFFGRPAYVPEPVRTETPVPLPPGSLLAATTADLVGMVVGGVAGAVAGTGAYPVTVHVADASTAAPIQGVTVRATINALSFTATSNTSGGATFALDGGVYTLTATAGGYAGAMATANVSAGSQVFTLGMVAQATPVPDGPGQVTGTMLAVNANGSPAPGAVYQFEAVPSSAAPVGEGVSPARLTATANTAGVLHVTFAVGVRYRGWAGTVRPLASSLMAFDAPAAPFVIPSLLRPGCTC